jgi:PAS domain S-box-containing protein
VEQALTDTARSEERYRLLTERADDIIFTLDRKGFITFINPAVEETLGYKPEELIGRHAEDLYTEEQRALAANLSDWMAHGPRTFTGDIELRAKDGRIISLEVKSSVMMVDGHPVGIQGAGRDMTERSRMEQELRRLHTQDRRRVDQLVTLNEIGRKIAALQPMEALLPDVARKIGRTFGYEHVRVLLHSDTTLSTIAAWNHQGHDEAAAEAVASPLVLRALEGDAGFVAGSGRPEDDAATRYTEIAVPIKTKSAVLGVLDVRGGPEGCLDESDIFTLQILADQIAVAVENARLYETGQRLAVSEERNRLARDLHDSVTQELFSMTMIAGALPLLMDRKPEAAKERLSRLHDLARGALAEMRALLFALRPAALEDEGLVSALRKHAAAFEHREGVAVDLKLDFDERLPNPIEEALYRVAQEALNNVAKHARATRVEISLTCEDERVCLTVRDDGAGMDQAAAQLAGTFGLRGMRERVTPLSGDLRITSASGEGTTVCAEIPVPAEPTVPVQMARA